MLSSIHLNGTLLDIIEFSDGEVQILIPEEDYLINFNKTNNISWYLFQRG